jgi:hypothetical protein
MTTSRNPEMPEDFDYAGLECDLEELEAEVPAVRAAADQYEAVKRDIIGWKHCDECPPDGRFPDCPCRCHVEPRVGA